MRASSLKLGDQGDFAQKRAGMRQALPDTVPQPVARTMYPVRLNSTSASARN